MNSLQKLAHKFQIILKQSAYRSITDIARDALGYKGNKYPAEASSEVKLEDGRTVKLLTSQEAREKGSLHRIFIECKSCDKFIPIGRIEQHEPSCMKKRNPIEYQERQKAIKLVNDLTRNMFKSPSLKEKIENYYVLQDLLSELADKDAKFMVERDKEKNYMYWLIAESIIEEKFGPHIRFDRVYSTDGKYTIVKPTGEKYSLEINGISYPPQYELTEIGYV